MIAPIAIVCACFMAVIVAQDTTLICNPDNLEEEREYRMSCDFILESLWDLETDALRKKSPSGTTTAPVAGRRKKRAADGRKKRATQVGKPLPPDTSSFQPLLPFLPEHMKTHEHEELRKQVCKSLLVFPGTRKRCCSTLSLVCPEHTIDYTPPPPPEPPKPVNNILEQITSQFQELINQIFIRHSETTKKP